MQRISVDTADFSIADEIQRLSSVENGAIASFIGTVRAPRDRPCRLVSLTLEHYPGMTEKALRRLADEASARWPLGACTIIHRIGRLLPGANIVFVGTASAHREAALSACAFLIDWLKTSAPFWKSEEFDDGSKHWVAARDADEAAAQAWLS